MISIIHKFLTLATFHFIECLDVYHVDDLLVAAVGIKDYGEMDNKNLGKRFGVPEKLPSIKMFINGDVTKWLDYSDGNWFSYSVLCVV